MHWIFTYKNLIILLIQTEIQKLKINKAQKSIKNIKYSKKNKTGQ